MMTLDFGPGRPIVPDRVSVDMLFFAWKWRQQMLPACRCPDCQVDAEILASAFRERIPCPNLPQRFERGREEARKLAAKFPEPEADDGKAAEEREAMRKQLIRKDFPKWDE